MNKIISEKQKVNINEIVKFNYSIVVSGGKSQILNKKMF